MTAPPGWHQQDDGRERFWDGEVWTEQFRGGPVAPVPTAQVDQGGGFYKPWMGYVGAGLTGLLLGVVLGAAGGSGESQSPAALPLASAPVVTQTVQSTVTATATATAAPPSAAPTTPAADPTTPAAAPTTAPVVETFTMPKLVGQNLQLAQDKLQKLGSFVMDQQDALGLDRIQVIDSNWQVCAQKPAPGKKVAADTVVVLSSVKLTEDCP